MNNRILLKSPHPDNGYVEILYGIENLVIAYGNFVEFDIAHYEFIASSREKLPFADHPELRGLYDGWGWNVGELMSLLDGVELETIEA